MPTRPDADCFGPPGGSGRGVHATSKPNALSLLATAGRTTKTRRPARRSPTSSASASGICGIGGVRGDRATSFWYLKVQPRGGHGRRGSARDPRRRRGPVLPRARTTSRTRTRPSSSSRRRPGRRPASRSRSSVVEHKCVTESDPTFATTCTSGPAAGVTVAGGRRARPPPAPTAPPQLTVGSAGDAELAATRGTDIPSEALDDLRRPSSTTARRRAVRASSAARRPTRSRAPAATTRSARAAATTGSTLARAATDVSTAARAPTR